MWSAPQRASRRRLTIPVRYAARPKCMPLDPAIRVLSRSKNAAERRSAGGGGKSVGGGASLGAVDLENNGVPLAAAAADRGAAEPAAAAAKLGDQGADDPRAGGADRVPEGDRAAVDVDVVLVDAEHPQ